jgi:organic hydroperoxide reductase OsmC/OhrA
MPRKHKYETHSIWKGDRGEGTADYRAYDRAYDTTAPGREPIRGSSDPAFRGDAGRWNPELLLVAALSQCHMLSYLHRCAVNGVVVTEYEDTAEGVMVETPDGGGHFEDVVLRPVVTVAARNMAERAEALHEDASAVCFIASSVSFPVRHEPQTRVRGEL